MTLSPLVQVYVKIRLSTHNELEAAARDAGMPMTEFIREAIEQKLRVRRTIFRELETTR